MPSRVRVIGRIRPSLKDNEQESVDILSLSPSSSPRAAVPLLSVDALASTISVTKPYCKPKSFKFDRILPPRCTQGQVFDASINVPNMIEEVFKGMSGGVMAYGQTGAGKTFTMFGDMGNDIACKDIKPPIDMENVSAKELLMTPEKNSSRATKNKKQLRKTNTVLVARRTPPLSSSPSSSSSSPDPNKVIDMTRVNTNTVSGRVDAIKQSYVCKSQHIIKAPSRLPPPPPSSVRDANKNKNNLAKKMMSPPSEAGIIPRTVRALFAVANRYTATGDKVSVIFSFVQVYNETVSDLLQPTSKKSLAIRESPELGVFVPEATQVIATSVKGVLAVLRTAAQHRAVRSTKQNASSSRSHAILRFGVTRSTPTQGPTQGGVSLGVSLKVRRSTLTFVDLAGSERITKVGGGANAARETCKINKSISTLGNVIKALGKNTKSDHVPFRDSKLTRILTETLNGKAACVLIANVSNDRESLEENLNTLMFAERAMYVQTKPKIDEKSVIAATMIAATKPPPPPPVEEAAKKQSPLPSPSPPAPKSSKKLTGIEMAEQYRREKEMNKLETAEQRQHNNLVERNCELEKEVVTLKRLLELQEASLDKVVQPPTCSYDLLELAEFETETETDPILEPAEDIVDVFEPRRERNEFASSLYNKADDLLFDAAKLKRDLLAAAQQRNSSDDSVDPAYDFAGDSPGYTRRNSVSNSPADSSGVVEFAELEKNINGEEKFEEERKEFHKKIDKLTKELTLKNVTIMQLEAKVQRQQEQLNAFNCDRNNENNSSKNTITLSRKTKKGRRNKTPLKSVANFYPQQNDLYPMQNELGI